MTVRNWIEAGVLILIIGIGCLLKIRMRKKLEEIDGLGEVRKKGDMNGRIVADIGEKKLGE